MAGKHGQPLRGLSATRSELHQGRFGRMFRNLPPASYGKSDRETLENIAKLAAAMHNEDEPKDMPDDEESGIPALFTYFGQFVDHDITFDPTSSLNKQNDPDALVDFRNPALNLDNVYGRGPADQPYMYSDGKHFLLGEKLAGGDANATDLPRNRIPDTKHAGEKIPGRALIGDPRNDENSIVSQLQGLFLRFHNRFVDEHHELEFEEIQQWVRFHYQYVVLNDFLPRIVSAPILDSLKDNGRYDQHKLKYYHWHNDPFMPVEFSVAAYRLGHSMIRPGYRLNDHEKNLLPIFPDKTHLEGLTGFQAMKEGRGIDWGRFIDIDTRAYGTQDPKTDADKQANFKRLQFAYRIDASLVGQLLDLPMSVAGDKPVSLPERNLIRGFRLGLPSGQSVAHAMGLSPLDESKIIIGQAIDNQPKSNKPIAEISTSFAGNCPLWAYVLAEAAANQIAIEIPASNGPKTITTPQLGPVGGRIVAEVFLGLMFGDGSSLLSLYPLWEPKWGAGFGLKDFVKYALGGGDAL